MQIGEIVQPRDWVSLISSPATLYTRHSARKCRRYFRRKQHIAINPLHDRNLELVYEIRERNEAFRMFRQLGELNDSPLGFNLTIEEHPAGAELELRFAMPRWFTIAAAVAYTMLIALAFFAMDWWPCLLTLAVLAVATLVGLHVVVTDRRELERFLADRFADDEKGEFSEEEWGL